MNGIRQLLRRLAILVRQGTAPLAGFRRLSPAGGAGLCLLLSLALAGCASVKFPEIKDVVLQRKARSEAAMRQFERDRDLAEYEDAQSRWRGHDVQGCRESLEKLLARNPNHLEARLLMAELLQSENRAQEAISCLEPALRAYPDDARLHYALGLTLDAAGRPGEAISHFERAAKIEPDNGLYAVEHQRALAAGNKPGGAVAQPSAPPATPNMLPEEPTARWQGGPAVQGEVIPAAYLERSTPAGQPPAPDPPGRAARRPGSAAGSSPLAAGSRGADRSSRAAYAEANDSADNAGPNSPGRLFEQGAKALSQGSAETATVCFRQAMAAKPGDPQIPLSAAVLALQYNRPEMAIEVVERSLNSLPNSAALYRILGAAYYRRGDYQASQSALQQALSLDKSSALSYFLMGCTLARLGQAEAAETHFRQAQAIDSRYTVRRGGGVASSTSSLVR